MAIDLFVLHNAEIYIFIFTLNVILATINTILDLKIGWK